MRRSLALGCLLALLGCGAPAAPASDASTPSEIVVPARPAETAPRSAPAARAQITIPAGTVLAGSLPGTAFRRPSREADQVPIELPDFSIDRLPYPGDPLAPPRLVASRAEAAALCADRGARLCTELEWERACEGDAHHAFAGGEPWGPDRCGEPAACASELGVQRLGESAPEWTASDVAPESIRMGRSAVQRGARADAPPDLHRCDARTFETPEAAAPAAFRCCVGAASPAPYPPVAMYRDFRELSISPADLRAAMRSVPELAPWADRFVPYGEAEGDLALACAGVDRRALAGWELATGPFAWSPSPGEEAWVFAGRSAGSTLVALLYPLPGGQFVHGGSFVLEGEELPIAIARTPPSRAELQWSACWGTPAEGGVIRWGDDSILRVIQR